MFTFIKERIIRNWPATVRVALDGGKTASHAITLDLNLLTTGEYRQLAARGDAEVIAAIVLGWGGIAAENGDPLPFTEENRDALAGHPGFVRAVLSAYMDAAQGEAGRKN